MIRAIIFDCFGVVLTDAMQNIRQGLLSSNPNGAQEITDIIAANNHGLIEPHESNQRIARILGISVDELRAQVSGKEVRDEQLLSYVQELRKHYKTAMLSNIAGSSLVRRFTDEELDQYFDVVVASGDIGYAKPEPEAYEIVAQRLGVRLDECLFTDDRELFCAGATSVGMQAILYTDFVQFKQQLEALIRADSAL
jgi:HAD superfamily hydrolase (TIGR01509 family)